MLRAWAALPLLGLLAGCGMVSAPVPPSLKLPQPVTNLTAQRTGDAVTLRWTMPRRATDKVLLVGDQKAEVCRQVGAGSCAVLAHLLIAPGSSAEFLDHLPAALVSSSPQLLTYTVILQNHAGQTAGPSNAAITASGPAPPPLTGLTARASAAGVVLGWVPAKVSGVVRIHRLLDEKPGKGNAGIPVNETLEVAGVDEGRALDASAVLDHMYTYTVQRVARLTLEGHAVEVDGEPGGPLTIDARDVFPPAVPQGLQAVPDALAGAIDLSWLPDTEADLAGYIVYRREAGSSGAAVSGWVRISPPGLMATAFRDLKAQPGRAYDYAVSAVDHDGNESARSAAVEESLPQ